MDRPGPGKKIDQGQRTVSGQYFDLACALVGISQEEVARRVGVAASTLSRGFSGKHGIKREKLLAWGDYLLEICPPENRDLLRAMEAEMLHTLGYATREDEQQGVHQLTYYQNQVNDILAKRQQGTL
jgi:transcriptional regulator with XRE-family HTH domain